tara:strand:- start:320 stop:706 length:387 start_codon:yes stop_codon:yes gene_type:complete
MIKNLLVASVLLASGCIIYVDNGDSTHSTYSTDMWVEQAWVDCTYDYYWGETNWQLTAEIGASYYYYTDEVWMEAYLDGWEYYPLYYDGFGWWSVDIYAYNAGCYDFYYVDFIVSDIYGNYDELRVYW